jgi:hypothetical protein
MSDVDIRDNGHLNMGEARAGNEMTTGRRGIDWATVKLIEAQIVGIAAEVEIDTTARYPKKNGIPGDYIKKLLPPNTPLSLEESARAIGMKVGRARRLQTDPHYMQAFDTAIRAYRASTHPQNIRTAITIRDNLENTPRDRLKAIQVLEGPRSVHVVGQVTNNYSQTNQVVAPAGYVIDLTPKEHKPQIEAKPVPASERQNVGDVEIDVDAERRENRANRDRPTRE